MKKIWGILLLALLAACAVPACGEIGFAEVNRSGVNFRKAPGGAYISRLDAPQSVYVFEEKTVDGQLWCHVYTFIGKDSRDGWIRGDMLRFLSEEFAGVVSVQAGDHYVAGLRGDGTVAIMGDDMPHLPCIDEVRIWSTIAQVTSSTCSVYALDTNGKLLTVGRNSMYGTGAVAKLCGNEPILLDADGRIMPENWRWAEEGVFPDAEEGLEALGDARCVKALGCERALFGALTADGRLLCVGEMKDLQPAFDHAPYADADVYWDAIVALRRDGRVDAAGRSSTWNAGQRDVSGWTDVVKVAAGAQHLLGLRADGTVYYAGDDAAHARQVAQWTNVTDIDAGNGYSIALMADGSVAMAGAYTSYER
ncbi:MAG: hypothetical protein ACI4MP_05925 [Candidatus Ventricola sp.]